jgi:hypothetical protein
MTATNKLIMWFGQDYMEPPPGGGEYGVVAATSRTMCIPTLDDEDFHHARAGLLHAGFDLVARRMRSGLRSKG